MSYSRIILFGLVAVLIALCGRPPEPEEEDPFEEVPAWNSPNPAVTDFDVSPDRVQPGEPFNVETTVANKGTGAGGASDVVIYMNDEEIHRVGIGDLESGGTETVDVQWEVDTPGRYLFRAELEPWKESFDMVKNDNVKDAFLWAGGDPSPPAEVEAGMIWDEEPLKAEESCVLTPTVRNCGFAGVAELPVMLKVDNEAIGETVIDYIEPGETQEHSFTWQDVTAGQHVVAVHLGVDEETYYDAVTQEITS